MASIGLLKSPILPGVGGCIDLNWYQGTSACPLLLRITCSMVFPPFIVVNFAGRGKTDQFSLLCPFTDPYVTSGGNTITVDVWAAYRAGVWTSSTTILIYGNNPTLGGFATLSASKAGLDTVAISPSVPLGSGVCPATLIGTVTVTDTGGISIV